MRKYLKMLRENAKMTQDEVAQKIGISRAYYVRIENGERQKDLDLSIVVRLSELFGVSVDWIVEQEKQYKTA